MHVRSLKGTARLTQAGTKQVPCLTGSCPFSILVDEMHGFPVVSLGQPKGVSPKNASNRLPCWESCASMWGTPLALALSPLSGSGSHEQGATRPGEMEGTCSLHITVWFQLSTVVVACSLKRTSSVSPHSANLSFPFVGDVFFGDETARATLLRVVSSSRQSVGSQSLWRYAHLKPLLHS